MIQSKILCKNYYEVDFDCLRKHNMYIMGKLCRKNVEYFIKMVINNVDIDNSAEHYNSIDTNLV